MKGLVFKSTHDAIVAEKDQKIADLTAKLSQNDNPILTQLRGLFEGAENDEAILTSVQDLISNAEANGKKITSLENDLTDAKAESTAATSRLDAVAQKLGHEKAGDLDLAEEVGNLTPEGRTITETERKFAVENNIDEDILTDADLELAELKEELKISNN